MQLHFAIYFLFQQHINMHTVVAGLTAAFPATSPAWEPNKKSNKA